MNRFEEEGRTAYKADKPIGACPYAPDLSALARFDWCAGWHSERAAHEARMKMRGGFIPHPRCTPE